LARHLAQEARQALARFCGREGSAPGKQRLASEADGIQAGERMVQERVKAEIPQGTEKIAIIGNSRHISSIADLDEYWRT